MHWFKALVKRSFNCLSGAVLSSTFYGTIPGWNQGSQVCLLSCSSFWGLPGIPFLNPSCLYSAFAWRIYTVAVSCIYANSKIRISVFCFSGQLLGHIIVNGGQVHLSKLMNFIFVMYGNLNWLTYKQRFSPLKSHVFPITQSRYVKKNCWQEGVFAAVGSYSDQPLCWLADGGKGVIVIFLVQHCCTGAKLKWGCGQTR